MKKTMKVKEVLKRLRIVYPYLKFRSEGNKIICINKTGYKSVVCLVKNGLVDIDYLSPEVVYLNAKYLKMK